MEQAVNFKFGGNSDDLDKMFKRAQGGMDQLEKMAGAVAGAFAFQKITSGFMSFIHEADEAEVAGRKLRSTMMASGMGGDPRVIEEMADALEGLTTFQADATIEAAAMMSRFKMTQSQIVQMMPNVQDLAAFMGTDLVTASDSVGRAVATGASALRSLNLGFDETQRSAFDAADAQGRVQIIMQKIQSTAPGMAQAMAQTASGAAKQLENAMDNVKQSIGEVLQRPMAAMFSSMAAAVRQAGAAFDALSPRTRGMLVAAGGLALGTAAAAAAFVSLLSGVRMVVPFLAPLATGFAAVMNAEISLSILTAALGASFKSMRAVAMSVWGGLIAPILAVAAAVFGVTVFVGALSRNWGDVKMTAREAWVGTRDMFIAVAKQISQVWETVTFFISERFAGIAKGVARIWGSVADGLVEKFVLIKSMLSGMGADEAGAAARKAVAESGGSAILASITDAISESTKGLIGAGGAILSDVGDAVGSTLKSTGNDLLADLKEGSGLMKGAFSDMLAGMGLNFDELGKKKEKGGVIAATGGEGGAAAALPAAAAAVMPAVSVEPAVAAVQTSISDAAMNFAGSMGTVGGVFSGVVESLKSGDVSGAIIGAVTSVISESVAFQGMTARINDIFTSFAQSLNPLFNGLGPILDLVSILMTTIGHVIEEILSGIQPIFAVISAILLPMVTIVASVFRVVSNLVQQALSPIMMVVTMIMPILNIVTTLFQSLAPILVQLFSSASPLSMIISVVASVFQALNPVFMGLADIIGKVMVFMISIFKRLGMWYNGVVTFLANGIQDIVGKIPGMADVAKDWANKVRGAQVRLGAFDEAMAAVTTAATTAAVISFPEFGAAAEDAKDKTQEAGQEIGNAPQGFKVALAEFNAAQAFSTAAAEHFFEVMSKGTGGTSTVPQMVAGSLPTVTSTAPTAQASDAGGGGNNVNIYVTNPDPAALAEMVATYLDRQALLKTGSPAMGPGSNRFATPATGSGQK